MRDIGVGLSVFLTPYLCQSSAGPPVFGRECGRGDDGVVPSYVIGASLGFQDDHIDHVPHSVNTRGRETAVRRSEMIDDRAASGKD